MGKLSTLVEEMMLKHKMSLDFQKGIVSVEELVGDLDLVAFLECHSQGWQRQTRDQGVRSHQLRSSWHRMISGDKQFHVLYPSNSYNHDDDCIFLCLDS